MRLMRRAAAPCLAAALLALGGCAAANLPVPGAGSPDPFALRKQANEAYDAQRWDEAGKLYRRLVDAVPADAEGWFRLGNVYARLGRPDQAVGAYREALLRQPGNAKAWHNMGLVQLRQAANSYREMLDYTDPGDPLHAQAGYLFKAITALLAQGAPAAPVGDGQ